MPFRIAVGQMAFITGSAEAVGAIHGLSNSAVNIYVENAGEFAVPLTAVTAVHDGKVMLDPKHLARPFLIAVGHRHDAEDPSVAG